MAPAALRCSFASDGALVPFYTGGPARLSPDGRVLAAACGDDAQLVDAAGGAVLATVPGDSEAVTALAFRRVEVHLCAAAASHLVSAAHRATLHAAHAPRVPPARATAMTAQRCTWRAAACSAGGGRLAARRRRARAPGKRTRCP